MGDKTQAYIDEIHSERGYLDLEHWRKAIKISHEEGRKSIIDMAGCYPNDQTLGETIRQMYNKEIVKNPK